MSLVAHRVSYAYRPLPGGRGVPALRGIDLAIRPGSITGLLGPNGCGKTTLLKVLCGVLAPTDGMVLLDGRPLSTFTRRDAARRLAVVPQETQPAFDYSAMEMVLMGRHPHLGPFQLEGPADLAIARDALAATDATDLAHRPFMSLSGGEKQRVVIASALAQAPGTLLLDEPTASLDLGHQLEIASMLTRMNRDRGVTLCMATHDLNLAAAMCDTLVLLRHGTVVAQGPTTDVLTSQTVRQLYDVDADVRLHETTGRLTVVPVARAL